MWGRLGVFIVLKEFLNLNKQPISNHFLDPNNLPEKEFFYDLKMGFDEETGLVSQMNSIPKEYMFNENYPYRSGMSSTIRNHFKKFSSLLKASYGHRAEKLKLLEIGSNDCTFLGNWDKKNAVGIEPCVNFALEGREQGYTIYDEFWDNTLAEKIVSENGLFDVIYSANCICHIENLDEVFSAVYNSLERNGVFVFEDPSLLSTIQNNSYDQLYDEHVHLFSVYALSNILKRNKLKIIRVDNLPSIHGGSNRIWVQKEDDASFGDMDTGNSVEKNIEWEKIVQLDKFKRYSMWALDIFYSRNRLKEILHELRERGKKIVGYGAASKTTTILNFCNIGQDFISHFVDTTPEKQGKLTPGTHIPIIKYDKDWHQGVDYVYCGAWNFLANEIIPKEKSFIQKGGKFITHVPNVRLIP